MGSEYAFDDFILENDPGREFTPSEVEAIRHGIEREESADGREAQC